MLSFRVPGSTERSVKVSGSREEVTQCIYHICGSLLDSPSRGETRLYRPDSGFGDGGGRGLAVRPRDNVSCNNDSNCITLTIIIFPDMMLAAFRASCIPPVEAQ